MNELNPFIQQIVMAILGQALQDESPGALARQRYSDQQMQESRQLMQLRGQEATRDQQHFDQQNKLFPFSLQKAQQDNNLVGLQLLSALNKMAQPEAAPSIENPFPIQAPPTQEMVQSIVPDYTQFFSQPQQQQVAAPVDPQKAAMREAILQWFNQQQQTK